MTYMESKIQVFCDVEETNSHHSEPETHHPRWYSKVGDENVLPLFQ